MKGWKKKAAASPPMRVAAVATASGLPSAEPASTKAMPHFHPGVRKRCDHDGDDRHLCVSALGELRHRQRDGIDIGQAGERGDRVEAARRKMRLHELGHEENHREQGAEFRCVASCGFSRASFENESVTAVDEDESAEAAAR